MKCKKCGNQDFSYVEGIRRVKIYWKLIFLFTSIFFPGMSANTNNKTVQSICLICGVLSIFILIGLIVVDKVWKERTRTKAICNNCGKMKWK